MAVFRHLSFRMSSDRKKYPLVLPAPRENINQNLDAHLLPPMSLSELAASGNGDEHELGLRILVGLKGILRVTACKFSSHSEVL
jgi:hypothetical protein